MCTVGVACLENPDPVGMKACTHSEEATFVVAETTEQAWASHLPRPALALPAPRPAFLEPRWPFPRRTARWSPRWPIACHWPRKPSPSRGFFGSCRFPGAQNDEWGRGRWNVPNLLKVPAGDTSGGLGEQPARFINRPHRQGPQTRHLHARQVNGVAPARGRQCLDKHRGRDTSPSATRRR